MAVNYNQNLGAWQIDGRGFYPTREDAEAAEGKTPVDDGYTSEIFANNFFAPTTVKAPAPRATSPDGLTYLDDGSYTPLYYNRMRAMTDPTFEYEDTSFVPDDVRDTNSRYKFDAAQGLYYTEDNHGRRTYVGNDPAAQARAEKQPLFTMSNDPMFPLSAGDGSIAGSQGTDQEAHDANARYRNTGSSSLPGGYPAAIDSIFGESGLTTAARRDQAEAEATFTDVDNEGQATRDDARNRLLDAIDNIGRDDTLSMQARADQQKALAMQSDLLDRILGFDPNAYADQFADNALARATALGRSSPGGASGRQAGIFNALEQMPSIQAEAQRQAQTLENQRLNSAQGAIAKFGDLAYGVRGQDSAAEEFNAGLGVEIANAFQDIFNTDSATDLARSRMYADIYVETMRNTRGYAEMDSNEKMALWREATAKRGQDLQFEADMERIRKQFPGENPIDVWLDRITKVGGAVVGAKTGGLI